MHSSSLQRGPRAEPEVETSSADGLFFCEGGWETRVGEIRPRSWIRVFRPSKMPVVLHRWPVCHRSRQTPRKRGERGCSVRWVHERKGSEHAIIPARDISRASESRREGAAAAVSQSRARRVALRGSEFCPRRAASTGAKKFAATLKWDLARSREGNAPQNYRPLSLASAAVHHPRRHPGTEPVCSRPAPAPGARTRPSVAQPTAKTADGNCLEFSRLDALSDTRTHVDAQKRYALASRHLLDTYERARRLRYERGVTRNRELGDVENPS